jgi:hypothetical protein
MRSAALGLVFATGLLIGFGMVQADGPLLYGQRPPAVPTPGPAGTARTAQAGDCLALWSDGNGGPPQLLVLDSRTRALAVYHVDRASGQVVLKSARNLQADLLLDEFNSGEPSPQEIRSLLPPR